MFSYITSNGKEYRYYDDEPIYPGDVWSDISHLQQRDPERTGYATQKPLKLIERLILASSNEGDRIVDPFAGSGSTLISADRLHRESVNIEVNAAYISNIEKRFKNQELTLFT